VDALRAAAPQLLDLVRPGATCEYWLERFFAAEDSEEIWDCANELDWRMGCRPVRALIAALHDPNELRRVAAAWALGWLRDMGAVDALAETLADPAQRVAVRTQAAYGLAVLRSTRPVPTLLRMLSDRSADVRFYSVSALDQIFWWRPLPANVTAAVEALLEDEDTPEQLWSVRRNALLLLGGERLALELHKVMADESASPAYRGWAAACADAAPRAAVRYSK
jgi:HEAT repeat protein